MTRAEHLLSIVAEECCEVAQRCTKALRFGLKEVQPGQSLNNAQRIAAEYADLISAMILLAREDADVKPNNLEAALDAKREKIELYLEYSAFVGCLNSQEKSGSAEVRESGEVSR